MQNQLITFVRMQLIEMPRTEIILNDDAANRLNTKVAAERICPPTR